MPWPDRPPLTLALAHHRNRSGEMRLPMVVASEAVLSPAATVLKGRKGLPKGRAVFTEAQKVGAADDSSDEEWDEEDEDSADEDGISNVGRGRVRLHAAQLPTSSALDDEDETRRRLAEKGWARRSVVIRGVSGTGAANLEELPGREDFPAGV